MIEHVFNEKKRISIEEFTRINEEISSEMFISIITLLQSSLPCSENFYRYKKNYERYLNKEGPEGEEKKTTPEEPTSPGSRKLASPKLVKSLSPVNSMMDVISQVNPAAAPASQAEVAAAPTSTLRDHAGRVRPNQINVGESVVQKYAGGEKADGEGQHNEIKINTVKSNKLSHLDKKHRDEEIKSIQEEERKRDQPMSP